MQVPSFSSGPKRAFSVKRMEEIKLYLCVYQYFKFTTGRGQSSRAIENSWQPKYFTEIIMKATTYSVHLNFTTSKIIILFFLWKKMKHILVASIWRKNLLVW